MDTLREFTKSVNHMLPAKSSLQSWRPSVKLTSGTHAENIIAQMMIYEKLEGAIYLEGSMSR